MGRPFQSPFAKPPGRGLSSSTVNVLWGFFNAVIAYLLVLRVGHFDVRIGAPTVGWVANHFGPRWSLGVGAASGFAAALAAVRILMQPNEVVAQSARYPT